MEPYVVRYEWPRHVTLSKSQWKATQEGVDILSLALTLDQSRLAGSLNVLTELFRDGPLDTGRHAISRGQSQPADRVNRPGISRASFHTMTQECDEDPTTQKH